MSKRGRPPIPTKDLLDDLWRVIEELGREPLIREYKERGTHSVPVYYDRFESWDEAVERAREEGGPVICEECGQEFKTEQARTQHHSAVHAKFSIRNLRKMDPEDLGLSPLGERAPRKRRDADG